MKGLTLDEIMERGNRRMVREDLELIEKHAVAIEAKRFLEIGVMDGTSTLLLAQIAKHFGGRLWSIDPKPTQRWFKNVQECEFEDTVTVYKGKSPWVVSGISANIPPSQLDFLFIDGDHRTRWALVDYHYWFPHVRIGGLIAFHDYNARKGVGKWVRRAIDIILEDDAEKLRKVGANKTSDRGTIIFEKLSE